jgi:hypothetical protein
MAEQKGDTTQLWQIIQAEFPLTERQHLDISLLIGHMSDPFNRALPWWDPLCIDEHGRPQWRHQMPPSMLRPPGLHEFEQLMPHFREITERDRELYRVLNWVRFHDEVAAVLSGDGRHDETRTAINFLRWFAVVEAHRGGLSWVAARAAASKRLKDTLADGGPSSMKWSHELIQRILRVG